MSTESGADEGSGTTDAGQGGGSERTVVVTPQGVGVHDPAGEGGRAADQVEQPAKVMRLGTMLKQLLEEVRAAPLDDAARQRLADVHARSIAELKDGLAPELAEELERVMLPFGEETPSDAELRVAQAQLVGWLEGLFHGIQTALVAQQMAAQTQLQQMRRALPGPPGQPGQTPPQGDGPTGQYL